MSPFDELPVTYGDSNEEMLREIQEEFSREASPKKKEYEPESTGQSALRHATRTGSRIGEAVVGGAGDILDFLRNSVVTAGEKITGEKNPNFEGAVRREIPGFSPPTSGNLKELSSEATEGYTEPRTSGEETSDEIASDFGSLISPGSGFLKPLGVALSANLAKKGVKHLEGSEGQQSAAKIATMFLLNVATKGNARKYTNSLYEKADKSMPKNALVKIDTNKLLSLEGNLEKGIPTNSKNTVLKPIDDIIKKLNSADEIPLDELVSIKRDLNSIRGEPQTLKGAKKLINNVSKIIDDDIEAYGKKNAPDWLKEYRAANEAFGGMAASEAVKDFISSHKTTPYLYAPLASVFGGALASSGAAGLGTAAAGLGAAAATAQTVNVMHRIATNPTLRKYYIEVVQSALAEDARAMSKAMNNLDRTMQKMDMEEKRKEGQKGKKAFTPIIG